MHPHSPTCFLAGLGAALSLGACTAPDFAQPCPIPPGVTDPNDPRYQAALNQCFPAVSEQPIDTRLKKDLDILFMIDNSSSMGPKQKQLANAIPGFIKQIDATGANYHVGVITSDIGTLPSSMMIPGGPVPGCGTESGDDGLLQVLPCTSRPGNLGDPNQEFRQACMTLCPDPSFVPQGTDRFISKTNGITNVPMKLVPDPMNPGQMLDIGPQLAFQCIGLVGDGGCGLEGQFESVKRALDGHLQENSGFLRDDSVLAVIYITDEDDCSVTFAQRDNCTVNEMSCPVPGAPDPVYTCYNPDWRCMAKDVKCNEPLDTPGPKTGCVERADTWLDPVAKYVSFLAGLRNGQQLVLGAIWAPTILDFNAGKSVQFGTGQLVLEDIGGGTGTPALNRGLKGNAACYNPDPTLTADQQRGFIGQAQLRLSTYLRAFDPAITTEQNICDVENYQTVLTKIATKIAAAVGGNCLSVLPNTDGNGTPACLVGFVDANQQDALPDTYLPICSSKCCSAWAQSPQPIGPYGPGSPPTLAKDPNIVSACSPEAADCYCAAVSTAAPTPLCQGTAVAGVWRVGDAAPPAGKLVNFRCSGTRPAMP